MKQGLAEVICILDMTGSMARQTLDTIGGFNQFIKEQKEVPGECKVTVIFFNSDGYVKWLDAADLKDVPELTQATYRAKSNTPLYDAMGKTIVEVGERLAAMAEEERPERVLVMTMTDGLNNWSKTYTLQQIVDMIARQRKEFSWEFVFIGADLDSFGQGQQFGIANSANTKGDVRKGYEIMSVAARSYRTSGEVAGFGEEKK